jgi:hypothetical protein
VVFLGHFCVAVQSVNLGGFLGNPLLWFVLFRLLYITAQSFWAL